MKQTEFENTNKLASIGRAGTYFAWLMAIVLVLMYCRVALKANAYEERMNQTRVDDTTTKYTYTYHIYTAPIEIPNTHTTVTTPEVTYPVIPEETVTEDAVITTPDEPEEIIPETPATISPYAPGEKYYYNVSDYEKLLMAKTVWAEARGECFEGQVAVAAVILNRFSQKGPQGVDARSIESVVTQKYQFAPIKNVTMEDLEAYPNCMQAVEAACKGWDPTRIHFPNGALYFYDPSGVSGREAQIREGIDIYAIGNHNFHIALNLGNA